LIFGTANHTGSSFLAIISASLTPAILILATGSLVTSTLTRLNRITDRARDLIEGLDAARERGDEELVQLDILWLRTYLRRSTLAERALTFYYTAIFFFVASSLAITVDDLTRDAVPWLSLLLVVGGALLLFAGTASLVIEANLATGALRAEIEASCGSDVAAEAGLRASLARLLNPKTP
jgi:hypothetical protein